jgi:hypothetical protein
VSGKVTKEPALLRDYFMDKKLDILGFAEINTIKEDTYKIRKACQGTHVYIDHNHYTRHHGTGFMVRKNVTKYVRNFMTHPSIGGRMSCLIVDFKVATYYFIIWYLPAQHDAPDTKVVDKIIDHSRLWVSMAKQENAQVVFAGDFNCNIQPNAKRNHIGRVTAIRNFISQSGLHLLPNDVKTWKRVVSGRIIGSTVDHVATSWGGCNIVIDPNCISPIDTDHDGVGVYIDVNLPHFHKPRFKTNKPEELLSFNDTFVNLATDNTFAEIIEAIYKSADMCLTFSKEHNGVRINDAIKSLTRKRSKWLKRKHQAMHALSVSRSFKYSVDECKKMDKVLRKELREEYRILREEKLVQNEKNAVKWAAKYAYKSIKAKPCAFRFYSYKNKHGRVVTSPDRVNSHAAKMFKKKFAKVDRTDLPQDLIDLLLETSMDWENESEVLGEVSGVELMEVIKSLPNNSSGLDGISNELIKLFTQDTVNKLAIGITELFTNISDIPQILKRAFVTLIAKRDASADDVTNIAKYRPIAVLPCLYRLVQRLINRRIMSCIEKYCVVSLSQRGFRWSGSCPELAQMFQSMIHYAVQHKLPFHALLINYSDAYPSVNHEVLFELMKYLKIPDRVIQLVKVMFTGHQIQVLTEYGLTDTFGMERGVPQGDPLSPLVFNIYIEVVARALHDAGLGFMYKDISVPLLSYADDNTIFANSYSELKEMIKIVNRVSRYLCLRINPIKTYQYKVSWTGKRKRRSTYIPSTSLVQIDGAKVNRAGDAFRFLGYMINTTSSVTINSKVILNKIKEATCHARTRSVRPYLFQRAITSIVHGATRYYSAIGHISESTHKRVNQRIRACTRYNMRAHPLHSSVWYHLPVKLGGCNIQMSEEVTIRARIATLLRNLNSVFDSCRIITFDHVVSAVGQKRAGNNVKDLVIDTVICINQLGFNLVNVDSMDRPHLLNLSTSDNLTLLPFNLQRLPALDDNICVWLAARVDPKNKTSGCGVFITTANDKLNTIAKFSLRFPNELSLSQVVEYGVATVLLITPNNTHVTFYVSEDFAKTCTKGLGTEVSLFVAELFSSKKVTHSVVSLNAAKRGTDLWYNRAVIKANKGLEKNSDKIVWIYRNLVQVFPLRTFVWNGLSLNRADIIQRIFYQFKLKPFSICSEIKEPEHCIDFCTSLPWHKLSFEFWKNRNVSNYESTLLFRARSCGLWTSNVNGDALICEYCHRIYDHYHALWECEAIQEEKMLLIWEIEKLLVESCIYLQPIVFWECDIGPSVDDHQIAFGMRGMIPSFSVRKLVNAIKPAVVEKVLLENIDPDKFKSKVQKETFLRSADLIASLQRICAQYIRSALADAQIS